jgi:hypothetical protein
MTKTIKHIGCATITIEEKLPLFDRPLSHTNDPATSYEAADKMVKSGELNRQEQEVYANLKKYQRYAYYSNYSLTAKELSEIAKLDYFMIQRRISGLIQKGKVEFLMKNGEWTRYPERKELATRDGCRIMRAI